MFFKVNVSTFYNGGTDQGVRFQFEITVPAFVFQKKVVQRNTPMGIKLYLLFNNIIVIDCKSDIVSNVVALVGGIFATCKILLTFYWTFLAPPNRKYEKEMSTDFSK